MTNAPKNFRLLSFHSGEKVGVEKLADRYFAILNSKLKKERRRKKPELSLRVSEEKSAKESQWHSKFGIRASLNNNQELNSTPLRPFLNN